MELNYLAIVVAAIVPLIMGAVWYNPRFIIYVGIHRKWNGYSPSGSYAVSIL
jgi:hypothetical protein